MSEIKREIIDFTKKELKRVELKNQWIKIFKETRQEQDGIIPVYQFEIEDIDSHESFEEYKAKQTFLLADSKLKLVLLYFVLLSDDKKIDIKEKKSIKKLLSYMKHNLSKSNYKLVEKFDYHINCIEDIQLYLRTNKIEDKHFREALHSIRSVTLNNSKYNTILEKLEDMD